jgi:hypothetical protein
MVMPGSPQATILVETRNVTRENLPDALLPLRGCWKSSSLLWMRANHFPVLAGLILNNWSGKSEEAVARFCRETNVSELLVRIEKPSQRWTRRRGGYTIPLERVGGFVEELVREGMIAILLEPANLNSDFFSLTCVSEVATGKIDVEVVGPGFDASDVLRADITPHERFEITLDRKTLLDDGHGQMSISRTYVVDREGYQASVRRRLEKIGARLKNPAFPEELMPAAIAPEVATKLAEDATRYLRESRQTALLDHSDRYDPIPTHLLDLFLEQVLRLSRATADSNVRWKSFSLAASFLSEDRLVIWDFFPPGDYDTTSLEYLRVPNAT